MIQEKMVRARRQYHHQHHHHHHHHLPEDTAAVQGHQQHPQQHHRHALNHNFHRPNKRLHVPNAPLNTTQFIMNDHELIEPDFDLMHNAIMEHYNKSKKRKLQHNSTGSGGQAGSEPTDDETGVSSNNTSSVSPASSEQQAAKSATDISQCGRNSPHMFEASKRDQSQQQPTPTNVITTNKSPLKDLDDEESKNQQQCESHQQQQHQQSSCRERDCEKQQQPTITTQLQESTNHSNPTTPSYRPTTGSPGDEDGLSPFINHEHLQSEFQEVYTNIHTERLSSMSKNQLVDKYLLLEERVEELENQLRESRTASASSLGCRS